MDRPIQFAFQNWNVEYDWWAPNSVPGDFMLSGTKTLPATHGSQWFDTMNVPVLYNHAIDQAFSFPSAKTDFLYTHGHVAYTHLPNLLGKKYIFPVMVRDVRYFENHKDIGFDLIDPRVFEDVKQNRARIVVMFPLEGTSDSKDLEILNSWCVKHDLKKYQVYYIHGNFKVESLAKDFRFTSVPIDMFVCWIKNRHTEIVEFNPIDDKNLFLSYNRRPRAHRIVLVCELIRARLLSKGLISFGKDSVPVSKKLNWDKINRPDLIGAASYLDTLTPIEIDLNLNANNPVFTAPLDHYSRTFLSIVPETLFEPNIIFFSEKIWKTISVGHPFMLVSSPGMLQALRSQGYATFDTWWDESYDSVEDLNLRVRLIVSELKRLSTLSTNELQDMRKQMTLILKHNQRLFNQKWQERCNEHPERVLYKEIEKIWESF